MTQWKLGRRAEYRLAPGWARHSAPYRFRLNRTRHYASTVYDGASGRRGPLSRLASAELNRPARSLLMSDTTAAPDRPSAEGTAFAIILSVSFCHLLNDMMQSLLTASYPLLRDNYGLNFSQIGMLTLTFQVTASVLQPLIGLYADKRPLPYSLAVGMGASLCGLLTLAYASNFDLLLCGAALIGLGSSVFHPESSRVARLASGGRYGLAQSLFQVGGNFGSAIGPLLAAFVV